MAEIKTPGMLKDAFERMMTLSPEEIELNSRQIDMEMAKLTEQDKQNRYENSGVGRKYFALRITDYEATTDELSRNLDAVKTFIADVQNYKIRTMWLCGKSGTGKTMLASAVIRECGGHFSKSYQIIDEIEDCRSFSSHESKTALIKRYANYPVLVIDEIGKFDNKNEIEFLFRILNERYENELSTILVTNKTKSELKNYIGIPLYDRFIENCTAVEFTGESYRKNIRAN